MPEPRDLTLVRNVLAILNSLDQDEIGATEEQWALFRADPCRAFLRMSSDRRSEVWRAVQARLPERLKEVASERESA